MSYPIAETEIKEATGASTGQFDAKKFIFKLIGFLPWIIISTLISYSIATLYLRYTAKVHKISAQLLIKDDEQSSPDASIIRELGVMPDSKEVQDQIDILQSYEMSKIVVDSLHLQFEIVAKGLIASSALYGVKNPAIIHVISDNDTATYKPAAYKLQVYKDKVSLEPATGGQLVYHNYGDTFLLEDHRIFVTPNEDVKLNAKGYTLVIKDTRSVATSIRTDINVQKMHDMGGILEISTIDELPGRAVDIVAKLIQAFNSAALNDKNIVANKTNQFLTDRVNAVERELDSLEEVSSAIKSANRINDVSTAGEEYLTEVTTFDNMRIEQEQQMQLLDGLTAYIQNAKTSYDIIPSANGLTDASLQKIILAYNDAVIEYNTQAKISTEKDPHLKRLLGDLNELRASVLKNIESVKLGYQTKISQLGSRYNYFNNLLTGLPDKERQLLKLKRQIGVQEQLYLFLLQKKSDAELSLAATSNDSRIVDAPHDNGIVKPNEAQIKMFSFLLGVLLPIIVMLLIDFFNNRISDRREVETGTRAPLLGELSYNKSQKNVIISPKSRSIIAEQFRLIRTNLQYLIKDNKAKVVLVTSFMSGEGKSFVSLNLAGSFVTGEKKVLLLELDLRKPKLAKYLNIKPQYGLTDYVVNHNIQFSNIIETMPGIDNVHVVTSGPIPPNPTELIMSKRLLDLLAFARQNYDYIVIDSSPVGLVADAFIIGKEVDVTLFILRHKYSYKTTIKYVESLYSENKLNNLSILINGIVASSGLGYGYGYGYGYSYGYGYHYGAGYYSENEKSGVKEWFGNLLKR